jgi:hypothetical protein
MAQVRSEMTNKGRDEKKLRKRKRDAKKKV